MWHKYKKLLHILLVICTVCTTWLCNNTSIATTSSTPSFTNPADFSNPGPFPNAVSTGWYGDQYNLNLYARSLISGIIYSIPTNSDLQAQLTMTNQLQSILTTFTQIGQVGLQAQGDGSALYGQASADNTFLRNAGNSAGITGWVMNYTPSTFACGGDTCYRVTGSCSSATLEASVCSSLFNLKLNLDFANSSDWDTTIAYLQKFLNVYVTPLYEYYQEQSTQAALQAELDSAEAASSAQAAYLQDTTIAPAISTEAGVLTGTLASTAPIPGSGIGGQVMFKATNLPPFDPTNCTCEFVNPPSSTSCSAVNQTNPFNITNPQTYMEANSVAPNTAGNQVLCKQIDSTIMNTGNTDNITQDDSCLTTIATYQRNCYDGCLGSTGTLSQNLFFAISKYFSMIDPNAEGMSIPNNEIGLVSSSYTQNFTLAPSSTDPSTYIQTILINTATTPTQRINVLDPLNPGALYNGTITITENVTTDTSGNQTYQVTSDQTFTRCMVPSTDVCFMYHDTVCCLDPGSGVVNVNSDLNGGSGTISFRAVYIDNNVCIETLLPTGFEVIGCKPRYIVDSGATNATTTTTECYVSNACIAANLSNSLAPIPVTAMIIQCVKETLDNLFNNPDTCAASANLLPSFQENMRSVIFVALCLYVIIFGIHVILGTEAPNGGEIFMFVFKMILVIYFSVGFPDSSGQYHDGLTFLYNALMGASADFSNMMLNTAGQICTSETASTQAACTNRGLCNYCLNCYAPEYQYLATWDSLDCRMGYYLGAYNPNQLVYGLLIMFVPLLFTALMEMPALLFLIFSILFSCFVIAIAISAVTIVSMSFIMISVLLYLAPIFVPCALFKWTKSIFDQWQKLLVSYAIQPVVIIGFISIMMSIFDNMVYSDCTFSPQSYVRNYVTTGSNTITKNNGDTTSCVIDTTSNNTTTMFFVLNDNQSESCQSSFGYAVNQIFADGNGITSTVAGFFSISIIANTDVMDNTISALPLLVIFGYVFYELMDSISGMAALLTDGASMAEIAGGLAKPTAIFKAAYGAVNSAFKHSPARMLQRGLNRRSRLKKADAAYNGRSGDTSKNDDPKGTNNSADKKYSNTSDSSLLTADKKPMSGKDLNNIKMKELDTHYKKYMKTVEDAASQKFMQNNPIATKKEALVATRKFMQENHQQIKKVAFENASKVVRSEGVSLKDINSNKYLKSLDHNTKDRMASRYLEDKLSKMSTEVAKLQDKHAKEGLKQPQIDAIKEAYKKEVHKDLNNNGYENHQIKDMTKHLQGIREKPEKWNKVRDTQKSFDKQLEQYGKENSQKHLFLFKSDNLTAFRRGVNSTWQSAKEVL